MNSNFDAPSTSASGMLALLELRGIGPAAADRLANRFGTLREIHEASNETLEPLVSASARTSLRDARAWAAAFDHANTMLEKADQHGVRVVVVADEDYPNWLKEISDRPQVLYVKGTLPRGRRFVACIGTREPSRFGEEVTKRIVASLAGAGWSVVSGLAVGVDALAHQAALENCTHTVAILANGLETVYPKRNDKLAAEILDAGGALVSEQPFGAPAIARNLVQRDRLQSGMSAGTIVMQTDVIGGSMHTVRFTLRQGRLLFAPVPVGAHQSESKSQGILALTRLSGRELSMTLKAEGDYAALLEGAFERSPVAIPISGRDDYQRVLEMLESAANGAAPRAGRSSPQLGLF